MKLGLICFLFTAWASLLGEETQVSVVNHDDVTNKYIFETSQLAAVPKQETKFDLKITEDEQLALILALQSQDSKQNFLQWQKELQVQNQTIWLENIKLQMMNYGGGGMDSGGGDGVILPLPHDTGTQLYSLDLVEYGLHKGVILETSPEEAMKICVEQDRQKMCIYRIRSYSFFSALLKKSPLFGQKMNVGMIKRAFSEFEETEKQLLLRELYEKYHNAYTDALIEEQNEEAWKLLNKRNMVYSDYLASLQHRLQEYVVNLYTKETVLAVAISNRLAQIYECAPKLASKMLDLLLSLDWKVVYQPIKSIDDAGDFDLRYDHIVQVASRSYGTVKINQDGWTHDYIFKGRLVKKMDYANKVSLIFHEVLYELTRLQGDTDSRRARNATARLLDAENLEANILSAATILRLN